MSEYKVFSAPGKALLAGGYLVLEPVYDSYITALSSRTHAVVTSTKSDELIININSPQFQQSNWQYRVSSNGVFEEIQGRKNPFLLSTVEIVMKYLGDVESLRLDITIFSDRGFHTQEDTTVKNSENGVKLFLYHKNPITEVAKTGLGSSASLVSVLTSAIVSQFKNFETLEQSKNLIHNLAQVAHCKAQGKIGSGFDVATAVYGSIKYRRFKPEIINRFVTEDLSDSIIPHFREVIDSSWDFVHDLCALPPHLKLLMGDIKGGSETPKLVSLVLNWKKANPQESSQLYSDLNQANLALIEALNELHHTSKNDEKSYLEAIEIFKSTKVNEIDLKSTELLQPFINLIRAIKNIRNYLKRLTILSGADIEPQAQTNLLDHCNDLQGVLGGVVPGAGGYDAICLLVVDESIDSIIQETHSDARFKEVSWLNLQEESVGLVVESFKDYKGLS